MPFEKEYDVPSLDKPACSLLRSKGMHIRGTLEDLGHPDDGDNQNCWCILTQHVIGPDDKDVERTNCVEGRECYKK